MRRKGRRPRNRGAADISGVECRRRLAGLTHRQREIAVLAGYGGRNKDIAIRLNIAERTVKAYLTVTYHKLGFSHQPGLSHRALLVRFVGKYLIPGRR